MELITAIVVSILAGTLSILAFSYTFSKRVEEFYEVTSDTIDMAGMFLVVGLLGKGLHKLYKKLFPNYHYMMLRITTFVYGALFFAIAIGVWFIDLEPFL